MSADDEVVYVCGLKAVHLAFHQCSQLSGQESTQMFHYGDLTDVTKM